MASALVSPKREVGNSRVATWTLTIVACGYLGWMGAALGRSTAALSGVFATMNVQLPAITRFLLQNGGWFCPALFGGAIVLLLAKQLFIRERWANVVFTVTTVLLMEVVANLVTQALFRPLLEIIDKLNS